MFPINYIIGFPKKYTNWKVKTFYQRMSSIKKNTKNATNINISRILHALPLNIYRKEICISTPNACSRTYIKIADYDKPGNNIVSEIINPSNDIIGNVEDINSTTLYSENGICNTATTCFLSTQNNARKRCRSSGMIPRKFNINKNNDTYSTSSQQYLISRNMTIKQNEYNYIRKGSSASIPGPGLSASNIYSPSGLSHCYQPQISTENNNNIFKYIWADGQTYTVTIPDGSYNVESLNTIFKTIQIQNKTYFLDYESNKIFLMSIGYNTNTNSVILYAGVISKDSCSMYTAPSGATWSISNSFPETDPTPTNEGVLGATYFQIMLNTKFSNLIGFVPGIYFNTINTSSFIGDITPKYVPLYYKPNNPMYGVQGAVDASTRLQRLKYNTITTSAGGIRSAYGNAAANALAYGVSEQAYTIKTQVGDKVNYTPIINKQTGQLCKKMFVYR